MKYFVISMMLFILVGCGATNEWTDENGEVVLKQESAMDPMVEDQSPEPTDETDEMIPENSKQDELEDIGGPVIETEYSLTSAQGNSIVLYDFGPMMSLESPATVVGIAPRKWFFEGIFPITLMGLDDSIIAEGFASGGWFEPGTETEDLNPDDMIEFTSTITFEIPEESDGAAKLRFAADMTGDESEEEYVEEQVILAG